MKIKILLFFTAFSLFNFAQNIKGVDNNSFTVTVNTGAEKYSDEQKGNFVVRDYFEFSDPSSAGKYKLPYRNVIVAIPPGSVPEFQVISKSEKSVKNIIPKLNPEASLETDSSLTMIEKPVIKRIKEERPLLEVEAYFWYRDNYCTNLRVNTHRFDEASSSLIIYDDINIKVKLPPGFAISNEQVRIDDKRTDLAKDVIANYILAEQFKGNPLFLKNDTTGSWINYNAQYLKLGVAANSLYRIYKSDLTAFGASGNGIDPRTFQLFNKGEEMDIRVSGEGDGSFDDNDFIEFWGTKNYNEISHRVINGANEEYNEFLDRYTDTTYFFLTWGQQSGKRIAVESTFNSNISDTIDYYTAFEHIENNTMYQNNDNNEVANQTPGWYKNKNWFWDFLYTFRTFNASFPASNIYPGKSVDIYSKVISFASNLSNNSHNVVLKFNGAAIDSQVVNRFQQAVLHGTFSSNTIANGSNPVVLQNYANSSTVNSLVVDWFDVEYPRYLRASNDSLFFGFKEPFNNIPKIFKVTNITSPEILLYQVSPEVKQLTGYQLSNNILLFTDTLNTENEYYVTKQSGVQKPKFYYYKNFTNLRSSANSADYLAITHPVFSAGADQYISYISDLHDVTAKKIFVGDIFDEFSYGYPYPESIKHFLENTVDNWQSPKPQYVNLIGDACYDYKGYVFKATGVKVSENYVPSYGVPVSDSWYAAFDESFPVPQMQIGRLPVLNSAELSYYTEKLINNETHPYDEWNKRYLFFSGGGQENEFDYLRAANELVINRYIDPMPVSGNYTHFYKTANPQTDFGPYSPEFIKEKISLGGLFISYIGHSGTATWDNSINNAVQLKNKINRNPIITDFGCSTAKFAEPDIICFGERFLLSNDGQAISYIGNSSLGFVSSAVTAPDLFYKHLIEDSLHLVGSSHLKAKNELLTVFGNSDVNKVFALTNSLLGDPLTEVKIPNQPNFKLAASDILLSSQVNDTQDSVSAGIVIENLGAAFDDSISVSINHSAGGTSLEDKFIRIKMPERSDTIYVWLNINNEPGQHHLNISVDSENEIAEIYEDDNSIDFSFPVYSSSLRDLVEYKYEHGALSSINLLNPASYEDDFSVSLQLSKDENFTVFDQFTVPADTFFTQINFNDLEENQRFWFRYKIDGSELDYGSAKSFYNYLPSGFLLADSVAFSNQSMNNLSFIDGQISLSTDSVTYSVLSAGFYDGATCVIARNGVNLLSNSFFAGFGIAVLDENTLEVDSVSWHQTWNSPPAVQALADYVNSIETGKIVLIGVSDEATTGLSNNLINAIKTLGSTKIDSLKTYGSWALIGKKGAAPGQVIERVSGRSQGSVFIDSTFSSPHSGGELITNIIGPASRWEAAKISDNAQENSEITYTLFGINKINEEDSLSYFTSSDSLIDLSFINSDEYPFIQIAADFAAGDNGISPEINLISVDYDPVPELGLNYQAIEASKDTIFEGGDIALDFSIFNSGEAAADSVEVLVNVINPAGEATVIMDSTILSLSAFDKKEYSLNYIARSNAGTGNFSFRVQIDSAGNINELYKDNNTFEIPFYVKADTATGSVTETALSAMFNGKEILNGDYVLPNPEIEIVLEYPSWFPINDTTAIEFYLDQAKLSFTDIYTDHDSANKKLIFNYSPVLADGEHTLRLFAKNSDGLIVGAPAFEKTFFVSNEVQLLNVYNYPNPFVESTSFTFTLTQVPDELKIKIYTIAGRLIKEISKTFPELDVNFNKIYWDGRDEDGDPVANGVYLYKVIMKKGNETRNVTEKLARLR